MKAFLNIFTKQTWAAFRNKGSAVTGFRTSRKKEASQVTPGDLFACYLSGASKWVGVLEVASEAYEDPSSYFLASDDPFILRFKVHPLVTVDPAHAVAIKDLWEHLDMCKEVSPDSPGWAYKIGLGQTLRLISDHDADLIARVLSTRLKSGT